MKRLIVGLAAAVVSLGLASQVSAADMPVKARPGAYDPCGVARFTGFYAGGNVGAAAYTANRNDLDGFLTDNGGYTATKSGITAGVQVGYDWQSCNKVFGLVADWNWADLKANTRDEPNDPADPDQGYQSKLHWFSTIRARAGLAVDNTLFYVTGGVAAAKIKTTITEGSAALGNEVHTFDKTRWGLTAGVGAEFALWDNWSLNTELLYMQFKKESVTLNSPAAGGLFSFDLNDSAWVGRIGLNYRWDNPRTAMAASYPVKGGAPVFPCGPARFSGFYAGGNAGAVAYSANRNDLDGFLTDNNSYTATKTAGTAGVQVGWDWQSCHRLFGVVADWNWTSAKATTLNNPNTPNQEQSIVSKMDWFSTIRGRAGLAVDDTMIYVTGGVAAANITTTISEIQPPQNERFPFEKTRWGLVGGVGAEFALWNGWSVNSELLYMQFKKQTVTFNSPGDAGIFSFDNNDSAWVTRVGLNYRWDNPRDAYAAAMPVKGTTYPCGPARFNGFYAGGNVGAIAYTANRNDLDGFLTDNGSYDATKTKVSAGAQVGYDWQFCHKVVGVVADWNWTNAETLSRDNPNAIGVNNSIRSKMDSFATLRTRTGLAVNDTLVYVTGGLAAAKINTTYTESIAGAFTESVTSDKTRWGWTGGVGAEFVLWNGWSATGEVLYMQFKKESLTATLPINGTVSFDNNDSAWVGRVGLNYRFGDAGKGPVVAKF